MRHPKLIKPLNQLVPRVKASFITEKTDPLLFQLQPQKLPPLPRTRDLLSLYGVRAKKGLSQNFLLNSTLLRKLVRASGIRPGYRVIEVGPGPANLTREILKKSPFEVLAIEKDRRFLPLLEQLADAVLPGQFKILLGDALDHDFQNVFGDPYILSEKYSLPQGLPTHMLDFCEDWTSRELPSIRLIGNLPFSVSLPLIIKWLHHISKRDSFWSYGRVPMLLTFQEEVARRICAAPASYERTRLSVMVQNYCNVKYQFRLSGKSFVPPALVDTGVVRFTPHVKPICQVPFRLFEKFVRHIFHHRQKNLEYNYKSLYPLEMHDQASECFKRARVNPQNMPYMLGNLEAGRLCDEYYLHCLEFPSLSEFNYRASKKLLPESSLKVLREAGYALLESPDDEDNNGIVRSNELVEPVD